MAGHIRERWMAGLMAANLAIAVLLVVDVALRIGQPFGGFLIEWSTGYGGYRVAHYTPSWWPGILRSGLRGDDALVKLDGRPFGADHPAVLDRLGARGNVTATLQVRRSVSEGEEEIVDTVIPVMPFGAGHLIDFKSSEFIVGLCYWLLALIVYRSRPADPVNRAAVVAASMLAGTQWFRHYTPRSPNDPLYVCAEVAWNAAVVFLCPALIRFALLFTGVDPGKHRNAWRAVWVAAAVASAGIGGWKVLMWSSPDYWTPAFGDLDLAVLGVLALASYGVGFVFVLIRFGWAYRRTPSARLKRQLRILFIGMGVAVFAFAQEGFVVPEWAYGATRFYVLNGLDMRVMQLGIPLAFTFVIVRYQTLRSASPLFVFVLVLASGAFIASIGGWVIRLSTPSPDAFSLPPFVPVFAITLLVGGGWAAQPYLRSVLGRMFQWEARGLEALRGFGQRAVQHTGRADLAQEIARSLVDELKLEQAALYDWDAGGRCYRLAAQSAPAPSGVDCLSPADDVLLSSALRIGPDAPPPPAWLAPLRARGFEAVAPLVAPGAGGRLGLLALGKRWDEEIFHARDMEIIALIAEQVSLFLLTQRQIDELRQVPRRVAEAQERERSRIAQELHDTIQQFLGGLPLYLETSRRQARRDPQASDAMLRECIEDVRRAAQTVRQIRSSLSPIQVETSLAVSLAEHAKHFQSRTGLEVRLDIDPGVDAVLSSQARHELYRVAQQALDNVAAHARATRVEVVLGREDGRVTFRIADDGRGFTDEERAAAAAGGHFGLISMRDRVGGLGGELRTVSAPGRGTRVEGWVPVERRAPEAP